MNTLIIQDSFAPYYAGRSGFAAPDLQKRSRPRERVRAERSTPDIAKGDRGSKQSQMPWARQVSDRD